MATSRQNPSTQDRTLKPVDWLHYTIVFAAFSITGTLSLLFSRLLLNGILHLDGEVWSGPWEKDLPSELYYHPASTPPPPMVGKLTLPAEEITWDGRVWDVTSDRFVPAGAMHLANELNWLGPHLGSVPFPEVTSS